MDQTILKNLISLQDRLLSVTLAERDFRRRAQREF